MPPKVELLLKAKMVRRNIFAGLVVALVMAWTTFSFALRTTSSFQLSEKSLPGLVFTGQFDRIERGLDLLGKGEFSVLFITGVNQGAGLNPETFTRQFQLQGELAGDLADGRIILATKAQDTIENALEASCWLNQNPDITRVVLITSSLHMPRASITLERASHVTVERLTVGKDIVDISSFLSAEFWKYTGTWFLTLLPKSFWPSRSDLACSQND